eukprot:1309784-Ditylum_brightwellii.AAC.1
MINTKDTSLLCKYIKNRFCDSFGLQNLRSQGAKIPPVGLFFRSGSLPNTCRFSTAVLPKRHGHGTRKWNVGCRFGKIVKLSPKPENGKSSLPIY